MVKEDYCSYEVAKLLKEKGFPMIEHLFMHVNKDNVFMTHDYACLNLPLEEYFHFDENYIPTITHQMAMKWLREKGWHISILFDYRYINENLAYIPLISPMKEGDSMGLKDGGFPTYEQGVEVALKYCLTELL